MNVKKKVNDLKNNYESKLSKLQKICKHNWVDDGTDVRGWQNVKCYKCTICGKTKPD